MPWVSKKCVFPVSYSCCIGIIGNSLLVVLSMLTKYTCNTGVVCDMKL